MADPRLSIISERLKPIGRIVAVSSGKGGVGKSIIASTLSLVLRKEGYRVGLFDLDFTSPSTHMILGIEKDVVPKEEKGLVPPIVNGLEYMSIVYYTGERTTPLRGEDVSNALIELLSVTKWGQLDFLVIDMPPGIGDATLDLVRLIARIEFLIVTTPSQLAFETVRKLASLLDSLKIPILGVTENMKMDSPNVVRRETSKLGLNYMAGIRYDPRVEAAIGNANSLVETTVGEGAKKIADAIAVKQEN